MRNRLLEYYYVKRKGQERRPIPGSLAAGSSTRTPGIKQSKDNVWRSEGGPREGVQRARACDQPPKLSVNTCKCCSPIGWPGRWAVCFEANWVRQRVKNKKEKTNSRAEAYFGVVNVSHDTFICAVEPDVSHPSHFSLPPKLLPYTHTFLESSYRYCISPPSTQQL